MHTILILPRKLQHQIETVFFISPKTAPTFTAEIRETLQIIRKNRFGAKAHEFLVLNEITNASTINIAHYSDG
jgi:hypothetical protein